MSDHSGPFNIYLNGQIKVMMTLFKFHCNIRMLTSLDVSELGPVFKLVIKFLIKIRVRTSIFKILNLILTQ